jgi:hypothetical protein
MLLPITVRLTGAALLVVGLLVGSARYAGPAAADGNDLPYGPDTCRSGYVWRAAFEGDTVCVTPQTRAQTAADNAQAAARREPNGGAYGPNTCRPGYVWRVARPDDLVCVTPATRAQVAADNARANERWQASAPGTHTLALDVGRHLSRRSDKYYTDTCNPGGASPIFDPSVIEVGWAQIEANGDPCLATVAQVAVLFDTRALDRIRTKVIDRAVLTYDERPSQGCPPGTPVPAPGMPTPDCSRRVSTWTSGSGAPEDKPNGCVVVRIPTADWPSVAPPGLIPYVSGARPAVGRLGARAWDVTEPFAWQSTLGAAPLGATPGRGFLLSGGPSLDQLEAEDNTSCMSVLSNIRLQVTYTVPPDEPFREPR